MIISYVCFDKAIVIKLLLGLAYIQRKFLARHYCKNYTVM